MIITYTNLLPMFNLGTLLKNLVDKARQYGSGFIIFLGILMIAVAAFKIGKGLMTQGKPNAQPINWFLCGGLILIGGTMAFGGFNAMGNISKSVGETMDDLSSNNENKLFKADDNNEVNINDGNGGMGQW